MGPGLKTLTGRLQSASAKFVNFPLRYVMLFKVAEDIVSGLEVNNRHVYVRLRIFVVFLMS